MMTEFSSDEKSSDDKSLKEVKFMEKRNIWIIALVVAVAFGFFADSAFAVGHKGSTLNAVQGRGVLRAGVFETEVLGFIEYTGTTPEAVKGGLEPDLAKALATAVLGNPDAVEFVPVDTLKRFSLLDNNKIDVSFVLVTQNSLRDMYNYLDTKRGYEFGPVYYYDGTSVMLKDDAPAGTKNIIVHIESSNYGDLKRFEKAPDWPDWKIKEAAEYEEAQNAFITGEWDDDDNPVTPTIPIHGFCTDQSALISLRYAEEKLDDWYLYPSDVEPKSISKSPLAVTISEGDTNWAEVVTWVFYVLLEAEEQGYGNGSTSNPELAKNGLPPEDWFPTTIPGLDAGWPRKVIQAVGNYGEIFERNLIESDYGFSRGNNRLWKDGGLMYSYPF